MRSMMPYKKGTSGNQTGRTAGRTPGAKLRKAIEEKADDILQAVINMSISVEKYPPNSVE